MKHSKLTVFLLCSAAALLVAACGGAIEATIGGTVSGLSGNTTVGLLDNGTDALTVGANGNFTFATQIEAGSTYSVIVSTEPIGETCTVTNGVGVVEQSVGNVNSVAVNCVATISANNILIGNVSGLASGTTVTLLNNGTDTEAVSSNGSFAFPTALAVGASYSVVVSTQPSGQTCSVANATGVIPASGAAPSVIVTCS